MLIKLFVQNYALIRELDLNLDEGLTIITGETGAGKSILLGALSLILGARADSAMLLDKNEKCIVEGTFRIGDYDLKEFFLENELDHDPVTILRREVNPAGKSRAFINDTPVTINLLKDLGERLIDIHSQHQTLMLNDSSFQLNVIDSFAGNIKLRNNYRAVYNNYRRLLREYNELKEKTEKNQADLEYFLYQLDQLEKAALKPGEQDDLEREQDILSHAGETGAAVAAALMLLSSGEPSILSMMREVMSLTGKVRSFIPGGNEIHSRLDSTYIELDDLADGLDKISSGIEADPQRLSLINNRLDIIYSLIQKHRVSNLGELLVKKEEIRNYIKSIATGDERLAELRSLLERETSALRELAAGISEKRKKSLGDIEQRINEMLLHLGMPNGKFRILLTQSENFNPSGIDNADFHFSANKQVAPENLARIASGGELSRVMLSLKSLLAKNINLPTIIFDEIDSGVSGEVADKVGQILSSMGKYMQVINITHLPQVASRGTKHFHVFKDDSGDSTITRIKLLTGEERVFEVARLLSGSEVTETAIKNALELLQAAGN